MGYHSLSDDGSCQSEVLTVMAVHITWFIDPACVAMLPSAVNVDRQERVGEQMVLQVSLGPSVKMASRYHLKKKPVSTCCAKWWGSFL